MPKIIASVDINIVPIKENIFNAAKSEDKWVEASLVKVPTVASNFGVFKQTIMHGETGLLCNTTEDWYKAQKALIIDEKLKKNIGDNSSEFCKEKYNILMTGTKFQIS